MIARILPAAVALLVGFLIGALATGSDGDSRTRPRGALSDASPGNGPAGADDYDPLRYAEIVDSLSALVNLEVAERRRLEAEFEALSDQVARLEQLLGGTDMDLEQAAADAEAKEAQENAVARQTAGDQELERFLAAGFSPERAEYLKRLQDELAMERLFIRDQAVREGWINSSRYGEELRELNEKRNALHDELGDDDYDRYLYAIGRPNRVVVRSVLEGSPAQQAGLRPGDAVISYDGQRVFQTTVLVSATSEGSFGSATAVEVERDGQRLLLYIPRGPLGVNMRVSRVKPE